MDQMRFYTYPHYPDSLRAELEDWNRRYDEVKAARASLISQANDAISRLATGVADASGNDLDSLEKCSLELLAISSRELALIKERDKYSDPVYKADSDALNAANEAVMAQEENLRKKHEDIPEDALAIIIKADKTREAILESAKACHGRATHVRNFVTDSLNNTHPCRKRAGELSADITAKARKLFGIPSP